MNRKEYKDFIKLEVFGNRKLNLLRKIGLKYFTPNTNCIYLTRKMWYLYQKGTKISRIKSALLYVKIHRRYGCCIDRTANVAKGFHITHAVGIVMGPCTIGENFRIYQNCIIGVRHTGDAEKNKVPRIGNNVKLYNSSMILGNVKVGDNVVIGANSLCNKDIVESGVYVGNPVRKIGESEWQNVKD